MRGGGKEQTVLEPASEFAYGAGELRLNAVVPTARRRGMMGLIQDEQATGQKGTEPLAHGIGIGRIDQQVVRHQEPAVGTPGIHAEAAVLSDLREVGSVQDGEQEAETLLHLRLPLLQHGCGGGDNNRLDLLAQQQLPCDEARFDGLPQAGIIGNEQIDPGQFERLAERLHLIGIDLDPGPERRLEEIRIGGSDAVPA